tara:strand:+ start:201 stop:422 length:222 start_codon:yes stop_codon:yes gene_type:complete
MKRMLVYIDSICWADLNNKDISTNVKDLSKNEYVEVPFGNIDSYNVYLSVKEALKKTTSIEPWYFNMEYVCEV